MSDLVGNPEEGFSHDVSSVDMDTTKSFSCKFNCSLIKNIHLQLIEKATSKHDSRCFVSFIFRKSRGRRLGRLVRQAQPLVGFKMDMMMIIIDDHRSVSIGKCSN